MWQRLPWSSRSGGASCACRTRTRSSSVSGARRSSTSSRYYIAVGDGIVRALYERPTQLKRHPDGAEGEAIYQKRVPEKRPDWIETARVTFPSGRHADELCVTEVAQVIWAANLAHARLPPLAVAAPRRGAPRRAAHRHRSAAGHGFRRRPSGWPALVREVLEEIGYVGWPKTSGNRGIHIAVPDRAELGVPGRPPRRRSRSRGRSSGARPSSSRPPGGRRSAARRSSSTTTRTPATGRSPPPTRCGRVPTRPCRRPSPGTSCPDVETEDFTIATMPSASRSSGTSRRASTTRLRPRRAARVGGAGRGGGSRRGAVSAALPEDAGRAAPACSLSPKRPD